jgi:hypothetical protein
LPVIAATDQTPGFNSKGVKITFGDVGVEEE